MVEYNGPDRVVFSVDVLERIKQEDASRTEADEVAFQSGIPSLDGALVSFENGHNHSFIGGELVVISGDEGEGKSTLARSLTHYISDQNHATLWFSYEETPRQFLKKFGEKIPLFLLPNEVTGSSVPWMIARYKEAVAKYGKVKAIFIDHLHYLADSSETNQNAATLMGVICRQLKKFAVHEDVVVFLLVHTNRSEAQDEPSNRSLRDSGMIGKEADTIMFVWRLDAGPLTEGEDNHAVVKVTKARGSGKKNVKVHLHKVGHYLKEWLP